MNETGKIKQQRQVYIDKVKQLDDKIHELQIERKEYSTVIDTFNRELDELKQPKLFKEIV